jgi:hypothetical protein
MSSGGKESFWKEHKEWIVFGIICFLYILILCFGAYKTYIHYQKRRKLIASGNRLPCSSCTTLQKKEEEEEEEATTSASRISDN